MQVLVVGGVAAGPKTASRIKRLKPEAEVTIIEKDEFLSYAGCGLPYYISDIVHNQADLMSTPVGTVRDQKYFAAVKDFKALTGTEALSVNRKEKKLTVRHRDGKENSLPYDKLVLATGSNPIRPALPGIDLNNILCLQKIEHAEAFREQIANGIRDAVIVGGGLIGVEMAEALVEKNCRVTVIERLPHILPMLDEEMAVTVEQHLREKGVKVMTGTSVTAFQGNAGSVNRVVTDQGPVNTELVLMSVGVKANIKLARDAGLKIGETGAVKVNEYMQSDDPDIYAVGDCAETTNLITGKAVFVPLGSTANKMGRVAANHICGHPDSFPGIIGSSVCRVFDYNIARSGLGEKAAADAGFDAVSCLAPAPDKPHFMPDAKPLFLKLIADRKTRRILGIQAVGPGVADKRADVAATAITAGMTVDQMANLDLCYAPPYSPAMDNLLTAANVLRNKLDGLMPSLSPMEVKTGMESGRDYLLLDVRSPAEYQAVRIQPSLNIPLGALRKRLHEIDRNRNIVVFCKISLRGYEAATILSHAGFENVHVMDGGILMWPYEKITG